MLKIVFWESLLRELSYLHVHCPSHEKCDFASFYVLNSWLSVKTITPSLFLIALVKSEAPMTCHSPCTYCMYVQTQVKKMNIWPPFWKMAAVLTKNVTVIN